MLKLTTHTIVKNEDQFVYFALKSVAPQVSSMLVYNDASTDHTKAMIDLVGAKNIIYEEGTGADVTTLRNYLLAKTSTDWFLLLDGDEIWNKDMLTSFLDFLSRQPKNINAVAMRTKNFVGDIYHILPEDAGKYHILGRTGHLSTRAFRKLPGVSWQGTYPLERYDYGGEKHQAFFEGYYWHATHLQRSSSEAFVPGFRRRTVEKGLKVDSKLLPEVFFDHLPPGVPSPKAKRSFLFEAKATLLTPLKKIKRTYA